MQKTRIALVLSAALISAAVWAANGTVATVNGVAIPESRSDLIVKQLAERGQPDSPDLRAKIREELIRNEIIRQEALSKKLDQSPDYKAQEEVARTQILLGVFVNDYLKNNPVSDADLKARYDAEVKAQFSGKEYHARHILVATEAEAKAVLAALKKGKKFEDLAKEKSIDTNSKPTGGDLGWSMPGNYVQEFADALQKLPKGKISDTAVKSQFGYHIIKVEDIRDAKGPAFEEVKPQLQQAVQGEQLQKLIADLRAKAKVE